LPKRIEIYIWMIGGGGFSYFFEFLCMIESKTFLINKL